MYIHMQYIQTFCALQAIVDLYGNFAQIHDIYCLHVVAAAAPVTYDIVVVAIVEPMQQHFSCCNNCGHIRREVGKVCRKSAVGWAFWLAD